MISLGLELSAWAASRELCIGINHDFDDTVYSAGAYYDLDDFLNDTTEVEPFRGARVHVTGPESYDETEFMDDETGCSRSPA